MLWTQNISSALQHFSETILLPFLNATLLQPLIAHYTRNSDHAVNLVWVTQNGKAGITKKQQT